MKFEDYLTSDKSSLVSFWFWTLILVVSIHILRSKKLEAYAWEMLKCDIFFIDGKCQQSGNCCRQLMLVKKGIELNTEKKFKQALDSDKKFERFFPNYEQNPSSDKKIKNFSCTCLSTSNICMDYHGRPSFCKTYPFSIFIKDDKIPSTCGYFINIKKNVPSVNIKSVQDKITAIVSKNLGGN